MKGITFERERKGYSVEQVDAYIDILQENYKKVAATAQKAEDTAAELEQRLLQQKEKLEAANRKFEEEKKELKRRFREQEAQVMAAGTTNTAEQQQLERQNSELQQQLEQQKSELQQLERWKTENSKLNQQNNEKDQEINQLRDQVSAVEKERSSWQDQLKQLTEENQQLKAQGESSHDIKGVPERLTELYTKAQEQADAYVENVKQDMEAERAQIASERETIIARAKADARKIEEAARQAKYDEYEEAKTRLRIEQEEQLAEIAYLKQEAEAERTSAKEEAESIIRQARLKLNLSEEKDRIRMEKALSKSQRIETKMEEQYQQVHHTLTDSAKRLADLFEYISNIDEAKSVEEIRKFGEENGSEGSRDGAED